MRNVVDNMANLSILEKDFEVAKRDLSDLNSYESKNQSLLNQLDFDYFKTKT